MLHDRSTLIIEPGFRGARPPPTGRPLHERIEETLWAACINGDAGQPSERTIEAFRTVDRALFVTPEAKRFADRNVRLPIGLGHWTPAPSILALATSLLSLEGYERVLEIGCGTGYHTALLARLAGWVHAVDRVEDMTVRTRVNMQLMGIRNVHVDRCNGHRGVADLAPFDAIIVGAAVDTVPAPLMGQLRPGGRLVAPVQGKMRVFDGSGQAHAFPLEEPMPPLIGP